MAKTFSGGAAISVERVTTACARKEEGAADDDDGDGGDKVEKPFQDGQHAGSLGSTWLARASDRKFWRFSVDPMLE